MVLEHRDPAESWAQEGPLASKEQEPEGQDVSRLFPMVTLS